MKCTLFEIAFLSLFALKAVGYDSNDPVFVYTTIIMTLVVGIYYILHRYTLKEFVVSIGFLLWALLVTVICGQFALFATVIMIVMSKGLDVKKMASKMYAIQFTIVATKFVLSVTGVIPNNIIGSIRGGKQIYRQSLGYSHPNLASLQYLMIVLLYFYSHLEKIKMIDYVLYGIVVAVIGEMTGSRTFMLLSILYMAAVYYVRYVKRTQNTKFIKFVAKIFISFPMIFFLFSVVPVPFYNNGASWAYQLNEALSGRIQLAARYFRTYSLNLFGQQVANYSGSEDYMRLDNGYLNILFRFGIIAMAVFVIGCTALIIHLRKQERWIEILIMAIFLMYGVSETYIYNIYINFTLLYFSEFIFDSKEKNRLLNGAEVQGDGG